MNCPDSKTISTPQWKTGIAAAFGTVFFGLFSKVGDHRAALLYAGFLFVPAAFVSFLMPPAKD